MFQRGGLTGEQTAPQIRLEDRWGVVVVSGGGGKVQKTEGQGHRGCCRLEGDI